MHRICLGCSKYVDTIQGSLDGCRHEYLNVHVISMFTPLFGIRDILHTVVFSP